MAIDVATLLRHMEEGFGGLPYPGDENIVASRDGSADAERLWKALKGLHWRDVPFEVLEGARWSVSSLSPEGFRFYLPAYMTFSILDPSRADVIPGCLVQALTAPDASDIDKMGKGMLLLPPMYRRPEQEEWMLRTMERLYASGEWERFFFERLSLFDRAQSRVIREFLEYIENTSEGYYGEDVATAIARYWYQFTEGDAARREGIGA
jgi:uncharacterized protein DUF6714